MSIGIHRPGADVMGRQHRLLGTRELANTTYFMKYHTIAVLISNDVSRAGPCPLLKGMNMVRMYLPIEPGSN